MLAADYDFRLHSSHANFPFAGVVNTPRTYDPSGMVVPHSNTVSVSPADVDGTWLFDWSDPLVIAAERTGAQQHPAGGLVWYGKRSGDGGHEGPFYVKAFSQLWMARASDGSLIVSFAECSENYWVIPYKAHDFRLVIFPPADASPAAD